jgi:S1-C subfamily serine protease
LEREKWQAETVRSERELALRGREQQNREAALDISLFRSQLRLLGKRITTTENDFAQLKQLQLDTTNRAINDIIARLDKLDDKAKYPKDVWDKASAVSGIIAGLFVAAIGALATFIFNRSQIRAEDARNEREIAAGDSRKAREIAVQEVQTIQLFMPQLTSANERDRETALLSIQAIGNTELATRLAELYGDAASVSALSKISEHGSPQAAAQAQTSLLKIFKTLESAVIRITKRQKDVAVGFFVQSGFIVTTSYVTQEIREEDADAELISVDGRRSRLKIVKTSKKDGLSLIRAASLTGLALPLTEEEPEPSTDVFALTFEPEVGFTTKIGRVVGFQTTPQLPKGLFEALPERTIQVEMGRSKLGSAGTPVVNREGRVVGVVYAILHGGETLLLVPAIRVKKLVESVPARLFFP